MEHGRRAVLTKASRPLDVLVLSRFDGANASVIRDFLFAFNAYSGHRYRYIFDCGALDEGVELTAVDVILVFWSAYILGPEFTPGVRERIRTARALKVLFLQDEYRDVRPMNQAMSELGVQVMFTCVDERDHAVFYPPDAIPSLEATYTVLTGYVPASLEAAGARTMPRPLDIGYRSRSLPYYLGDLAQEKRVVAERFQRVAEAEGWRVDISVREEDRLYGRRWVRFLRASRCVLGSASGASVVDFTGDIRRRCEQYLALNPGAGYHETKARFFADVDWRVVIDTVSPRVFEATALGCTLVQHEGRYGGVLEPDRHYIRVRRDYSNLHDVVARIRDHAFCRAVAETAHRDLIASGRYSYRTFVGWFDTVLARHARPPGQPVRPPVSRARFYARRYLRDRQTIVPYRDRFVVLPSLHLGADLLRQALAAWPARRQGRPLARLIADPASFCAKAAAALEAALVRPRLRRVLVRYLLSRRALARVSLDRVLEDLLKLELLGRARAGTLNARQPFAVGVALDPGSGVLTFRSILDPVGRQCRAMVEPPGLGDRVEALFEARKITAVVWDHSALGPLVTYASRGGRWMAVGLSSGAIHRFDALVAVARTAPRAVAAAVRRAVEDDGRTVASPSPARTE